uniref:Structural maintenance of chromosomes protein n=1 Tax=Strigamia maritima TaxID=126957 RepID=T1JGX2_STRMM
MYVKSMVIDGFKSYGTRTEISGFDPLFNAITGLNGSGKSNILDGICFLLGITNLSQVRATNLQELVYKNGQAGIIKATVSITFDNRDKKHSPIGYETHDEITVTRQIVVGGRNKYLINGVNAQNSRVQDLFHSVQLNVNNPHFLIMQGRITKVLNMKPPEILSMIEEAAGTKMYETKKRKAQETIAKKDAKLKEIDDILCEEIAPTLNKLKDERASYLEYQKLQREIEHLTKLWVAYQFICAEEDMDKARDEDTALKNGIEALKQRTVESRAEIDELEAVIGELQKKKSDEGGQKLNELDDNLKAKQTVEAKATSSLKNFEERLLAELKRKDDLQKNMDEDAATAQNKEKEFEKRETKMNELRQLNQQHVDRLAAAQKRFQAVSAGLSSNADGEDATLADQLISTKSELANTDTESKQAAMKLNHAKSELDKKRDLLRKSNSDPVQDRKALDSTEKHLTRLQDDLEKLNFREEEEDELDQRRRDLVREVNLLREKTDNMHARFPQLTFEYQDPESNFDRRKVYGLVCNLFDTKDLNTATALEVAAGGKLYNVVVDNEITAKKLLQHGHLKKRHTIIPLNKIRGYSIPRNVVQKAERLVGSDQVSAAISLITYNANLDAAMEFVFGSTLVCPNMDVAKRVAFHPDVQKRTVTFDGEVFDPAGTLSGGSRQQSGSVLCQVGEMKQLKSQIEGKQRELAEIENKLNNLREKKARYHKLKQQFDARRNEADLLKQKLQQSQHYVIAEEIKSLEALIVEQEAIVVRCCDQHTRLSKRAEELAEKIANTSTTRENELKNAETDVNNCKTNMEAVGKELKEKENEDGIVRLEIEELKKGWESLNQQMAAIDSSIKKIEERCNNAREDLESAKNEVQVAQLEVDAQKELLMSKNKEIQQIYENQEKLAAFINENQLRLTNMEHEMNKQKTSIKENKDKLKYLNNKYEWITDEKKYFGQVNTAYDFAATNPKEAGQQLSKLEERKTKLAKNVNMGAMSMLNKAEEQYQDLMKKKQIVENDKSKITAVIRELDEKKNEALLKAWQQVNQDFGSIFSTLLPGTRAKLVPPDGMSVLDGLEVKIAFGDVWKESLNELSGGQRSLVALSLILSMLLFKPAPIYILDEVDAALDLSHTQNIGQMLRTHFRHSQFIVVSLKDGMFNNANVLFKTKFVDGMSTVTRFAQ